MFLCSKVVMLQSRTIKPESAEGTNDVGHDLYILAGHEASYWTEVRDRDKSVNENGVPTHKNTQTHVAVMLLIIVCDEGRMHACVIGLCDNGSLFHLDSIRFDRFLFALAVAQWFDKTVERVRITEKNLRNSRAAMAKSGFVVAVVDESIMLFNMHFSILLLLRLWHFFYVPVSSQCISSIVIVWNAPNSMTEWAAVPCRSVVIFR